MQIIREAILIALLLFAFTSHNASGIRVKEVTYKQGLSENTITYIAQDSLGYIWIGTREGLNRYDGHYCKNYYPSSKSGTLRNGSIQKIFIDQQSNIWVKNGAGVERYLSNNDSFEPLSIPYKDASITNFNDVIELNNTKWLATSNYGIIGLESNGNKVKEVISTDEPIHFFSAIDKQSAWVHSGHSIKLFDAREKKLLEPEELSSVGSVLCMAHYKNHLWIGNSHGVRVYNGKELLPFKHFAKAYGNSDLDIKAWVTSMVVTEDKLWLSSDGDGIYNIAFNDNLELNNIRTTDSSHSITADAIRCLHVDRDSNIWLGTVHNGVNVIPFWHKKFYHLKYSNASIDAPYGNFSNFLEDENGQLWAASYDGLCLINQHNMLVEKYVAKGSVINAITRDKEGTIYMGSYNRGLQKYSPATGLLSNVTFPGTNFPGDNNVKALLTDDEGRIWIGSYGLFCFNKAQNSLEQIGQDRIGGVLCLLEDRNNNIWIGTINGLYQIEKDKKRINHYAANKSKPFQISASWINTLFEDDEGNIWIGTNGGGLNMISSVDNHIHLIHDKSLNSQVVHGIAQDRDGNIWFTTNSGLVVMDAENSRIEVFDYADGLINNQYIDNSMFFTSAGQMLCGGEKGIDYFTPWQITTNPNAPGLILKVSYLSNEQDDESSSPKLERMPVNGDTLVLNYNQSSFGFSFTGIDFANPEKMNFACRLVGFNNNWVELNQQRTVNYGHVPPGNYTFMARVANSDGVWSTPVKVFIVVKPPFYLSIYAYVFYLCLIVIILYVIYRYSLERRLLKNKLDYEHKERERIEELNQLKLRLFTHISHEFRTPLSLIIAPVQDLLSRYAQKGTESKELETIHANANKLKQLVNQVLELRKIESGAIQLKKAPFDMVSLIKSSCESFNHWARQKNIRLSCDVQQDELMVSLDQSLIEKVLYNLLSNAIKFTPEGSVRVELEVQHDQFLIKVLDTGVGITDDDQKQLFNMFYRAGESTLKTEGSGVGLALTKEVVELHKGHLNVDSTVGKGSCFTVTLPYEEIGLHLESQVSIIEHSSDKPQTDEEPTTVKLLLVEDNAELRAFLKGRLEQHYWIIEAENGREAIEKAYEHQPQIILSDVMMPEMNGWELCEKIKTDIKVSHIPIVLLTALGESEHVIKGLNIGADAYLSKPFNLEHLESLLRNILKNRALLASKYKAGNKDTIDTSQLSQLDQKLLEEVRQHVLDNINQPDFSVQVLSDLLRMSRANLHAKLKALCSLTPSEFIMQMRLQEACNLLKTKNYSMSEVSDLAGFSNASHFSRSFKKQFGGSPSDYLKGKLSI